MKSRIVIEYDFDTDMLKVDIDDEDSSNVEALGIIDLAGTMLANQIGGMSAKWRDKTPPPAPPHYTYEDDPDSKPKRWDWRNK